MQNLVHTSHIPEHQLWQPGSWHCWSIDHREVPDFLDERFLLESAGLSEDEVNLDAAGVSSCRPAKMHTLQSSPRCFSVTSNTAFTPI